MELEFRFSGESGLKISGIALQYGEVALIQGRPERFIAGSFGDLSQADILANIQHRRDRPIARTGGGGLELTDSADALRAEIDLPAGGLADELRDLLQRRILRGMSIEFTAHRERRAADNTREVLQASLFGISLVDRPAYSGSKVAEPRRRDVKVWTL